MYISEGAFLCGLSPEVQAVILGSLWDGNFFALEGNIYQKTNGVRYSVDGMEYCCVLTVYGLQRWLPQNTVVEPITVIMTVQKRSQRDQENTGKKE